MLTTTSYLRPRSQKIRPSDAAFAMTNQAFLHSRGCRTKIYLFSMVVRRWLRHSNPILSAKQIGYYRTVSALWRKFFIGEYGCRIYSNMPYSPIKQPKVERSTIYPICLATFPTRERRAVRRLRSKAKSIPLMETAGLPKRSTARKRSVCRNPTPKH